MEEAVAVRGGGRSQSQTSQMWISRPAKTSEIKRHKSVAGRATCCCCYSQRGRSGTGPTRRRSHIDQRGDLKGKQDKQTQKDNERAKGQSHCTQHRPRPLGVSGERRDRFSFVFSADATDDSRPRWGGFYTNIRLPAAAAARLCRPI